KGFVVGGRVFGYRNVDVFDGEDAFGRPLKSGVDREVNDAEASIVRRIFRMYDSGVGFKKIAKTLNREEVPKPRASALPKGYSEPAGWSPATVKAVLMRPDYRGVYVWGRTKKKDAVWLQRNVQKIPQADWKSVNKPNWRIIDDDALWDRVQARLREA